MRRIYIVLIRAHTGLAAAARKFTRYPYTHVAVCLDPTLTEFISYSRRYHYFPFDAGFTYEYRDYYAFGEHQSFGAKVFRLDVEDDNYDAVTRYIRSCETDTEQRFNLYSMMTMPLIGGFRIRGTENCMTFTAQIVSLSGCVKMKRPYWRYSVKQLDKLLTRHCTFEGELKRIPSGRHAEYMKRWNPVKYFRDFFWLNGTLIKRLCTPNDTETK